MIYKKLAKIRLDFGKEKIKKSGLNKFSGFKYYELGDIIPLILALEEKYGVASNITFTETTAKMVIVDTDNYSPDDPTTFVEYEIPLKIPTVKGANEAQNLGSVITYDRRYLYMLAYNIVENDSFDYSMGADAKEADEIKSIVSKIVAHCKVIAEKQDKAEAVRILQECGVIDGNPHNIKDKTLAETALKAVEKAAKGK